MMNALSAHVMSVEGKRQQRVKDRETLNSIENAIKEAALKGETQTVFDINFSRVKEVTELLENEGYIVSIFNSGLNEQSLKISWEF